MSGYEWVLCTENIEQVVKTIQNEALSVDQDDEFNIFGTQWPSLLVFL